MTPLYEKPRACHDCHEVKPCEEFPLGPSLKRRSSKCMACQEASAHTIDARRDAKRVTWKVDGRTVRRCSGCSKVKRLSDFTKVKAGRGAKARGYRCRKCESARVEEWKREQDPEEQAVKRRALQAKWRAAHPEAYKAQRERQYANLMADEKRRVERNEDQRMRRRLRRERAGLPIRAGTYGARSVEAEQTVPAAPIVAFINKRIEQRVVVENFIGSKHALTGAKKGVCEDLGIEPRQLHRWEHDQENASIGAVERVLLRAGAAWRDVYSREDHPMLYAEGGVLDLYVEAPS